MDLAFDLADLTDLARREGTEEGAELSELDEEPSPKSEGFGFSMILRVMVSWISTSSIGGGGGASGAPSSLVSFVSS